MAVWETYSAWVVSVNWNNYFVFTLQFNSDYAEQLFL